MPTNRAPAAGLLLALAAALLPGPADAAALTSYIASRLPWRSGAAGAGLAFAPWRHRALDVLVLYAPHRDWWSMSNYLQGPSLKNLVRWTPQTVLSLAMVPASAKGQFAACAAGAFDPYFRQFGQLMAQDGAGRAVVRLGIEPNVGSASHPWGVDSVDQIPAWVGCFRREAAALKATAPGLRIEWTMAKRGKLPVNLLAMYPGDDAVDLVGVHYYDTGPVKSTQALWDQYYDATWNGGPWGLGTWLAAARAHGKGLAVSEWGVWDNGQGAAAADDPVYIRNMYGFFRAHADRLEYESYFDDRPGVNQIFPVGAFPRASAAYQQLWATGQ